MDDVEHKIYRGRIIYPVHFIKDSEEMGLERYKNNVQFGNLRRHPEYGRGSQERDIRMNQMGVLGELIGRKLLHDRGEQFEDAIDAKLPIKGADFIVYRDGKKITIDAKTAGAKATCFNINLKAYKERPMMFYWCFHLVEKGIAEEYVFRHRDIASWKRVDLYTPAYQWEIIK